MGETPPGSSSLHGLRASADEDEDVGALRDLLPGFLDELGDYELLTGDLGVHPPSVAIPTDAAAVVGPSAAADGDTAAQTKRPPMQNSTRRRQKQEITHLRAKASELEEELEGLKKRLMRGKDAGARVEHEDAGGGAPGRESKLALRRVSRWERIAKHQLVEKQRAEMRNLKLHELLASQLKVARSLEKVLKKRPNAIEVLDVLEPDAGDAWSKRARAVHAGEESLYESLLRRTDAVYAELDAVCARHLSMRLDEETSDSRVLCSGRNELCMEVTSAKVVPFGLAATARAVWRCLSRSRVKLADGAYYRVDSTSDSVAAKAVMQLRVSDALALMHMRFVMKKFEEEGRVVLACVSASESEGPRDVLHGLRMMERVWVVIRPVGPSDGDGDGDGDGDAPSTIIQLCMRMTPSITSERGDPDRQDQQSRPQSQSRSPPPPPPQSEHASMLTDLILSALHRNLGWLFQTVENILMEQVVTLA